MINMNRLSVMHYLFRRFFTESIHMCEGWTTDKGCDLLRGGTQENVEWRI